MTNVRLFGVCLFAAATIGTATVPAAAQQANPYANATPVYMGDATYRLAADVVTSGIGKPGVQGVGCVNQTVFFPGDALVFRAIVADGPSGKPLTPDDVKAKGLQAVVALSDGTSVAMRLGPHPPPPNAPVHNTYWSGSIRLPADHPTGTLKWTLTVTDTAGHKTTFVPMGQDNGATVLTIAQK